MKRSFRDEYGVSFVGFGRGTPIPPGRRDLVSVNGRVGRPSLVGPTFEVGLRFSFDSHDDSAVKHLLRRVVVSSRRRVPPKAHRG